MQVIYIVLIVWMLYTDKFTCGSQQINIEYRGEQDNQSNNSEIAQPNYKDSLVSQQINIEHRGEQDNQSNNSEIAQPNYKGSLVSQQINTEHRGEQDNQSNNSEIAQPNFKGSLVSQQINIEYRGEQDNQSNNSEIAQPNYKGSLVSQQINIEHRGEQDNQSNNSEIAQPNLKGSLVSQQINIEHRGEQDNQSNNSEIAQPNFKGSLVSQQINIEYRGEQDNQSINSEIAQPNFKGSLVSQQINIEYRGEQDNQSNNSEIAQPNFKGSLVRTSTTDLGMTMKTVKVISSFDEWKEAVISDEYEDMEEDPENYVLFPHILEEPVKDPRMYEPNPGQPEWSIPLVVDNTMFVPEEKEDGSFLELKEDYPLRHIELHSINKGLTLNNSAIEHEIDECKLNLKNRVFGEKGKKGVKRKKPKRHSRKYKTEGRKQRKLHPKRTWRKTCCVRGKRHANKSSLYLFDNIYKNCRHVVSQKSAVSRRCGRVFKKCCVRVALRKFYIHHRKMDNEETEDYM
ncbi:uncharacterized protein LOC111089539 isoform X2 [Limulus polyphemus]|uniref:Uncharacterized protein LOC111089539 isoform X2 n=1 Tax=Limulus polyphemus TaxID=6850 RepID=A0ABM1TPY9_LIMPO|nr:uncharacterized protein LOC111089539 isoform X2 [Limulus polyphemus]